MQPRGPLMIEHRLIERMIALIKKEIQRLQESSTVNPVFIDTAVDFIRTYADRTHHGKEGRGRDAGCPAPPAQIRAYGTTVLGSCLR